MIAPRHADGARSDHPAVRIQLDRLAAPGPGADSLGLERIRALLQRLDHPETRLPPVFHVAGTNGKGSTCAFLRAMLEAAGYRVHVYTSPHLVNFNERIRLSGTLIDDDRLAHGLKRAIDAGTGLHPSFFEVTTAAAFLAFAETPADACVIEVGLGGRLDATNVLAPLVTGIAQIDFDHQQFLGHTLAEIAGEKAGIARPDVPLVVSHQGAEAMNAIYAYALETGAPLCVENDGWTIEGLLPAHWPLGLAGPFQRRNAALAIAMLKAQRQLPIPEQALFTGARQAQWPARLQRLPPGQLNRPDAAGRALWIDGAHNPAAATVLAHALKAGSGPAPGFHLILGILANKDADNIISTLGPCAGNITFVPVPDHASHDPIKLAARHGADAAPDFIAALRRHPGETLIAGSLYLAGAVLAANGTPPH